MMRSSISHSCSFPRWGCSEHVPCARVHLQACVFSCVCARVCVCAFCVHACVLGAASLAGM